MNNKRISFVVLIVVLSFTSVRKASPQSLISPASGLSGNIVWAFGEPIAGGSFTGDFITTQGMLFLDTGEISFVEDIYQDNISVSIYPNPVVNLLHISCSYSSIRNVKGRIYDANGKIRKEVDIISGTNTVDISEMECGLYLLVFVSDSLKIKPIKFTCLKE